MMLETNIDDMNPEIYSYIMPILFEHGALDVFYSNIIMKKNRPGIKLSVLCKMDDTEELENIIFNETSTLGIRKYEVDRNILERSYKKIKTSYGEVSIKLGMRDNKVIKAAPEYEDCKLIAKENNIPLRDVYQLVHDLTKLKL